MDNKIKLSHGSGTGQNELLHEIVFKELFDNNKSAPFEDAAVLDPINGRIAFTTDSFVVQPLEFPGGNIGKLAACGTINDLAMMGAKPIALSVSLILEEGLDVSLLQKILRSLKSICAETDVKITCGDTKVVDRGKADGIFINTSGIGVIPDNRKISASGAKPGDAVIISGPIGLHGIAILAARKGLNFASGAVSDCAPLLETTKGLFSAVKDVHTLRDCTRGGTAAVLNEIAAASNISIALDHNNIPVPEVVEGACSFLGMDPLHIPCEGRFIAILPSGQAETAVKALNNTVYGKGAETIGVVTEKTRFPVTIKTLVGGTRLVDFPPGELLPRIC